QCVAEEHVPRVFQQQPMRLIDIDRRFDHLLAVVPHEQQAAGLAIAADADVRVLGLDILFQLAIKPVECSGLNEGAQRKRKKQHCGDSQRSNRHAKPFWGHLDLPLLWHHWRLRRKTASNAQIFGPEAVAEIEALASEAKRIGVATEKAKSQMPLQ